MEGQALPPRPRNHAPHQQDQVGFCTFCVMCGAWSTSVAWPWVSPSPTGLAPTQRAASCSRSQRGTRDRHLPPYVPTGHPFPLHSCILPGVMQERRRPEAGKSVCPTTCFLLSTGKEVGPQASASVRCLEGMNSLDSKHTNSAAHGPLRQNEAKSVEHRNDILFSEKVPSAGGFGLALSRLHLGLTSNFCFLGSYTFHVKLWANMRRILVTFMSSKYF